MKLIIQIPCYNEEETLQSVLQDLPTFIDGIDHIETQIIDDGSTDNTIAIANKCNVDYIIKHTHNTGLAAAFRSGIENALKNGADILVNTDGDNQYNGRDIVLLVKEMLAKGADIVIGCRPIKDHFEFSNSKKMLQIFGSFVVRLISRTDVPDAVSGFRAYSKEAMLRLNILSDFSYCIETIVQGGLMNMKIGYVPVRVNPKTRESRLYKSVFQYLTKQFKTIIFLLTIYRSALIFNGIATLLLAAAIFLTIRFAVLVYFFNSPFTSTWPSLTLAGVLLMISCIVYLVGLLTSLLATQRKLSEEMLYHLRCMNLLQENFKIKKRTPNNSTIDF
ncbi:glycosyltransferase family 2 protein [Solidesulfovibrio sp. C21]|uniref:glycosyltransferase family 2 protein n=1 Tax=Solidesulfovibrio sp. C21 TaxID=3398613 RepID=UPI0039FBCF0E